MHVHGNKGARPSRFFKVRHRPGGAPEPAPDDGGRSRRQRTLVVSGSIALAGAAGVVLFASAIIAAKQVPFSVRIYAQGQPAGEPRLMRMTAYDAKEGVQVRIDSVELVAQGTGKVLASAEGAADASATLFLPARQTASCSITVRTPAGRRTASVPRVDQTAADLRSFDLKPVSAELRTRAGIELGTGTAGGRDEEFNTAALEGLRVVPYPEQGRLASNLPNRIFLWARDCPAKNITIGSAAGAGVLRTDETGMAEFEYVPSLGTTGFDLGCGGWKGRAELRDRPQGITASSPAIFAAAGSDAALRIHTIMAGRPVTMDVFRDCRWIDTRTIVPERGDAELKYRMPDEPGLYTFEFYANVHAPGIEKARVPMLVSKGDAVLDLKAIVERAKGKDREPLAAALQAGLSKDGNLDGARARLLAAAFLSRLDVSCGPPPLLFDSYDSDVLFLSQEKAGARKAAYTGIGVTWLVALAGAIVIMVLRLKAARDAEERLAGHGKNIALQHAVAAAIITIAFALLIYVLDIWWRQ